MCFQPVEKVQRKLGFCCLWWYNRDGDEDVRKEGKQPRTNGVHLFGKYSTARPPTKKNRKSSGFQQIV